MFSNLDQVISWFNHAIAWYVLALLMVLSFCQGYLGYFTRVPSRYAFKVFVVLEVPATAFYLITAAWQWPLDDPIGIQSILAQILLTVGSVVIHTFVLTMTNLWMQFRN